MKFIGTIGFGLTQLFDIPLEANTLAEAEKKFAEPDDIIGTLIDKEMVDAGVSVRLAWLNYEVIEVVAEQQRS